MWSHGFSMFDMVWPWEIWGITELTVIHIWWKKQWFDHQIRVKQMWFIHVANSLRKSTCNWQSMHLSIYRSIYLPIYLVISYRTSYLSLYLSSVSSISSIYLSIYRSIDLSIYLSIYSIYSCIFLAFLLNLEVKPQVEEHSPFKVLVLNPGQ